MCVAARTAEPARDHWQIATPLKCATIPLSTQQASLAAWLPVTQAWSAVIQAAVFVLLMVCRVRKTHVIECHCVPRPAKRKAVQIAQMLTARFR